MVGISTAQGSAGALRRGVEALEALGPEFFRSVDDLARSQPQLVRGAIEFTANNPSTMREYARLGTSHPDLVRGAVAVSRTFGLASRAGNAALDAVNATGLLKLVPTFGLAKKFDPVAFSAMWRFTRESPAEADALLGVLKEHPALVRAAADLQRQDPTLLRDALQSARSKPEVIDAAVSVLEALR